jgi:hypothetical protein
MIIRPILLNRSHFKSEAYNLLDSPLCINKSHVAGSLYIFAARQLIE